MAKFSIRPSQLRGTLSIPASKSHTLRALVFSLMSEGTSHLSHCLPSPDTSRMIDGLRLLGAHVAVSGAVTTVQGTGGRLSPANDVIDCGNSGQVLRFLSALAALSPSYTLFTGDDSIRRSRPMQPLLDGLTGLGAFAISSRGNGYAPILIRGPLSSGATSLSGEDSQPVSALLIACSFLSGPTEITIFRPGEKPWISLTLDWLNKFGIGVENDSFERYRLKGGAQIGGFDYAVPGDFSTAAFPIAAALLTDSELTLHPLDMNDVQGDKAIIPLLAQMGARFAIDPEKKTVTVQRGGVLKGRRIDVNGLIDALPILAVLACFAEGETLLYNGAIARKKESDRIHCMAVQLRKMGADIEEFADGLMIRTSKLKGAHLQSERDHRISLALSVAALAAEGESLIDGVESAAKTYPTFLEDFRAAGAEIEGAP